MQLQVLLYFLAFAFEFISAQYQQNYNGTQNSPYYAQQRQQLAHTPTMPLSSSSVEQHNQMYASSSSSSSQHSVYYQQPPYATTATTGAGYGSGPSDYYHQRAMAAAQQPQQQQQYGWPSTASAGMAPTTNYYHSGLPYTQSLAASASGSNPYGGGSQQQQQQQQRQQQYGYGTGTAANYGSSLLGGYGTAAQQQGHQQQQLYNNDGIGTAHTPWSSSDSGNKNSFGHDEQQHQSSFEQHQWHLGDDATHNNIGPPPPPLHQTMDNKNGRIAYPASYWSSAGARSAPLCSTYSVQHQLVLVLLVLVVVPSLISPSAPFAF